MKLLFCAMFMLFGMGAHAQYNTVSCSKRPFSMRLVQVDQINGSTVCYFEMQNEDEHYMNVYEDIVLRDAMGRTHKLLNSYNMPLSDEDHAHQLVLKPNQAHRFALEFEQIPLNQKFDIVESESNSRALNFYEVEVDTTERVAVIDYDDWVKDYPVMEHGAYIVDGNEVQYISYKGLTLTAHIQETNEYGKYYTIDLDVQNYTSRDVLLDPSRISATSFIPKKQKNMAMKVLSAEEYGKRVKRTQNWNMALLVAAEVAITVAAAAIDADTDRDYHKKHHHDGPPTRKHGWHPRHYERHPYYPTDYYRSHYHSHETGGLATVAAVGSVVATAGVAEGQRAKREALDAEYVKPNTVRAGQEYAGYFNIKHEKTDNLLVTIRIMGEDFVFPFQWQNKK